VVGGMLNTVSDIEVISPTQGPSCSSAGRRRPRRSIWRSSRPMWCPRPYMQAGRAGKVFKRQSRSAPGPYRMVEHQRGLAPSRSKRSTKYWGGVPLIKQVIFENRSRSFRRGSHWVESGPRRLCFPIAGARSAAPCPEARTGHQDLSLLRGSICFGYPTMCRRWTNDHVRAGRCIFRSIRGALSKAFYAGRSQGPYRSMAPDGTPSKRARFQGSPSTKAKAIAELKEAGYGPEQAGFPSRSAVDQRRVFRTTTTIGARHRARCGRRSASTATIEETTVAKLIDAAQNSKLAGPVVYSWANGNRRSRKTMPARIFRSAPAVLGLEGHVALRHASTKLMTEVNEPGAHRGLQGAQCRGPRRSPGRFPLLQGITTVAYSRGAGAHAVRQWLRAPGRDGSTNDTNSDRLTVSGHVCR